MSGFWFVENGRERECECGGAFRERRVRIERRSGRSSSGGLSM